MMCYRCKLCFTKDCPFLHLWDLPPEERGYTGCVFGLMKENQE